MSHLDRVSVELKSAEKITRFPLKELRTLSNFFIVSKASFSWLEMYAITTVISSSCHLMDEAVMLTADASIVIGSLEMVAVPCLFGDLYHIKIPFFGEVCQCGNFVSVQV